MNEGVLNPEDILELRVFEFISSPEKIVVVATSLEDALLAVKDRQIQSINLDPKIELMAVVDSSVVFLADGVNAALRSRIRQAFS